MIPLEHEPVKKSTPLIPDRLVSGILKLDPDTFNEFVVTTNPRVVRYFRKLGASVEEAPELANEAYWKFWQHMQKNGASLIPTGLSSYFHTLCHNSFIDETRRKKRRPQNIGYLDALGVEAEEDEDGFNHGMSVGTGANPVEEVVLRRETSRRVRRALATLEPRYRKPLELIYMEEYSYEDASMALDLRLGTVKSHINRGKQKLRQALGNQLA